MAVGEELIARANDYLAGRIDVDDLDTWLAGRVQELHELDSTDGTGAGLWGFIQVRIYQMHDGLPEDELRSELHAYLKEHGWLSRATQRATR